MPDPVPEPMDPFTPDETRALAPSFTNTDRTVFALTNLPETVKGALFARYSRSAKSVRRLFLDEFLGQMQSPAIGDSPSALGPQPSALGSQPSALSAQPSALTRGVGTERAAKLYARV